MIRKTLERIRLPRYLAMWQFQLLLLLLVLAAMVLAAGAPPCPGVGGGC
jgi:hypothetical protein